MIESIPRTTQRLAALCFALILGACAASAQKPADGGSGYLPSYNNLKEATDSAGVKFLTSGPITYRGEKLVRVYAEPARLFPAGVKFPAVDQATTDRSLQYFDATLRAQLARHFTVVDAADKAQVVLKPAVTRIASVDEGMKPLDFVPVRLVTKPLKDAVMGTPQKAAAVLEVLTVDMRNAALLNTAYRPATGKATGRSGSEASRVTFDSIRPVLDEWAASIAVELSRASR